MCHTAEATLDVFEDRIISRIADVVLPPRSRNLTSLDYSLQFYLSFCYEPAERISPKKYFSYSVLMSGLGLEPWLNTLYT